MLARQIVGYRNISRIRKWKRTQQMNKFLSKFHDPQSFYEYTKTIGQDLHLEGSAIRTPWARRAIFVSLFEALHIDLHSKRFLDLGPGSGESLDVAIDFGADCASFIDYDPYILAYNILKGYKVFHLDYLVEGFTSITEKFDVIVSRGSINADRFNRCESGILPFGRWLCELKNLASSNGLIIVSPTFDKRPAPYGYIPDLTDFDESLVNQTFFWHGFSRTFVKGFNEPPEIFPFTFINGRLENG